MTAALETWHFWDSGTGLAAPNMAWDETLLEAAAEIGTPVLRFYGWSEAAATFGYFQKHADLERITELRPLIRRPTGGGLVPHANDWTYSAIFPPGRAWYQLKAEESYRRMHEWIRDAFQLLDVATELAPCCQPEGPGQCFIGAEKSDLLFRGRKIAGAAQRRNKMGLLIQGSIQPPPRNVVRKDWQSAMLDVARMNWKVAWQSLLPTLCRQERADELTRTRYGSDEYNRKR